MVAIDVFLKLWSNGLRLAYLQTVKQRAPLATAPKIAHRTLILCAGELRGSSESSREDNMVNRGYPGGWAT